MEHAPALIQALQPTIHHYGYFAVAGLLFLEDFGVPVPGETTLIAAAFFAGTGQLNIIAVLIVAFVAAVMGDNLGYLIGRTGGHPLAVRFGKYVFLTEERLEKAEGFFQRNGGRVVLVARFIQGLRQANGIIAGITEMRWRLFLICNSIGAALWVTAWGLVGYFGGNHIATIYHYAAWVAVIGVLLAIIYFSYRKLTKKSKRPPKKTAPKP